MVFELQVLNSDATLNDFTDIDTARIVRGADATILLRILQPEKNKIRYVPDTGATFSITFLRSDPALTLVKVPTQPFADDRSILQIDLIDTETLDLISQSLNLEMNEGTIKSFAILQNGFQVVTLNTDC